MGVAQLIRDHRGLWAMGGQDLILGYGEILCTVAKFIDPFEHIYTHRFMRLLCNHGAFSGDCFLICTVFVPGNYFAIPGSILHPWHCSAPWKAAKEGGQWWPLPVIGTNFLIRSLPPPSPCLPWLTPNFFRLYL